jgi:hypothetical protein
MPPTPLLAPMQRPPAWQTAPGQQAPSFAPQFMQTLGALPGGLAQPRPALQVLPPQQAWPEPPHGAQRVAPPAPPSVATVWHERPVVQDVAPVQQTSPLPPHFTHVAFWPPEQRVPEAVQLPPPPPPVAQQSWPTPPQAFAPVPQEPFMHMPS